MLNLFDKLEIMSAVMKGNADYRRESREAGTYETSHRDTHSVKVTTGFRKRPYYKKNKNASVVVEPSTETATEPATETATEPATETATEPATETATEPATETATETATEPATETATEPATETATEPATETATKDYEQIMAEAQAPEEPVDAHINEAAMKQNNHSPRNLISTFGVEIDLDKMATAAQQQPSTQYQHPTAQHQHPTAQQLWAAQQMSYAHRVDKAPNTTAKVQRTASDDVDVKIPDITDGVVNAPHVKELVDPVPMSSVNPVSTHANDEQPPVKRFDNSDMISKYDYLAIIEEIALENNVQVQFIQRSDWLISVIIYGNNGIPDRNKGFTIDPGYLIDKRKKVFPGIQNFYEGVQAYPLFIGGDKKQINKSLIEGLICGGKEYPNKKEGLYREEYLELNRYVELISIPTKDISREERKWIQNQLVRFHKKGFFSKYTPEGSRFKITRFDKTRKEIYISNIAGCCHGLSPVSCVNETFIIGETEAKRIRNK